MQVNSVNYVYNQNYRALNINTETGKQIRNMAIQPDNIAKYNINNEIIKNNDSNSQTSTSQVNFKMNNKFAKQVTLIRAIGAPVPALVAGFGNCINRNSNSCIESTFLYDVSKLDKDNAEVRDKEIIEHYSGFDTQNNELYVDRYYDKSDKERKMPFKEELLIYTTEEGYHEGMMEHKVTHFEAEKIIVEQIIHKKDNTGRFTHTEYDKNGNILENENCFHDFDYTWELVDIML